MGILHIIYICQRFSSKLKRAKQQHFPGSDDSSNTVYFWQNNNGIYWHFENYYQLHKCKSNMYITKTNYTKRKKFKKNNNFGWNCIYWKYHSKTLALCICDYNRIIIHISFVEFLQIMTWNWITLNSKLKCQNDTLSLLFWSIKH